MHFNQFKLQKLRFHMMEKINYLCYKSLVGRLQIAFSSAGFEKHMHSNVME